MTRRNKRATSSKLPVLPEGLFGLQAPTWPRIKNTLARQPDGWRKELAGYLNVQPSAVTMMMQRDNQPSYQRVLDILAWLQGKGVEVE